MKKDISKEKKIKMCSKIKIESIFNLLLFSLGYREDIGDYCKLEGNEIVFYSDVSYHGSPTYKVCKRTKLSPAKAELLKKLLELKDLVEKVSNDDVYRNLVEERELLDKQVKYWSEYKDSEGDEEE